NSRASRSSGPRKDSEWVTKRGATSPRWASCCWMLDHPSNGSQAPSRRKESRRSSRGGGSAASSKTRTLEDGLTGPSHPRALAAPARDPYAGFWCGVLLWLGITLAMGAVATVFADAVGGLVPGLGGPLPRAVLLIAVYGGLAFVNIRGAALGSRVSGIATVAK